MEKRSRITLKDFARAAGVSTSAVSRILNNKETYCSEQKRLEILDLAKKWNYKPNIGYRIMTGMPTNITAIIFSQKRVSYNEHNLRFLVELIGKLEERGYATYSTVMTEDKSRNYEKLLELERKGCRSFIFIGQPVGSDELLVHIKKHGYCHIALSSSNESQGKLFSINETSAIFEYLKIFREKGIGNFRFLMPKPYFTGRIKPHVGAPELSCFRKNMVYIPSYEFSDSDGFDERYENAYAAARNEYRKDPGLRGIICITDYHALGAARFFHDAGHKVGEDVLVCGMFNTVAARFSLLPIITSNFDMKETAARMLEHLFSPDPVHITLKPEIITHRRSPS